MALLLSTGGSWSLWAQVAPPTDREFKELRQRMVENPRAFSWEERFKLRDELNRRHLVKGAQAGEAQRQMKRINYQLEQYNRSKAASAFVKTGVDLGLTGLEIYLSTATLGAGAPAAIATGEGLKIMLDEVWDLSNEQLRKDFERTIAHEMGQLPRSSLRTREEAQAFLRQRLKGNPLFPDLPADMQNQLTSQPDLRVAFQREHERRTDDMLLDLTEHVLDLQGQTENIVADVNGLRQSLNRQSAFLSSFARHTVEKFRNLEKAQADLSAVVTELGNVVNEHGQRLDKNSKDLEFVKGWMAGQLSSQELVQAAEQGVLSFGKAELDRIKFQARVEKFQNASQEVFGIAGEVVNIAAKLNVNPELLQKVQKSVQVAQAAVNFASSFASGNVLGCLKALGGFFGSKDMAAERHREVMTALSTIYDLQKQILENQQVIFNKLQGLEDILLSTRHEILAKMDEGFKRVHVGQNSLQNLVTYLVDHANLGVCSNVVSEYAQAQSDPRNSFREVSLLNFFAESRQVQDVQKCRTGYTNLFFDFAGSGTLADRRIPHTLFVHGAQTASRDQGLVDQEWDADRDFYEMKTVVKGFNELLPQSAPTLMEVFSALQMPTARVNDVLLRASVAKFFKEIPQWTEFFAARLQPDVLLSVSQRFRQIFPLFSRVSLQAFIPLSQSGPESEVYASTRAGNLRLLDTIYRHVKVAEAQERLASGSVLVPLLSRFILNPESVQNESQHVQKTELVEKLAVDVAKLLKRNPYLAQNYALYRMSENFDSQMRFPRMLKVSQGDLRTPASNPILVQRYRAAYERGDLVALRDLLPLDWRLVCERDLRTDLQQAWTTSYSPVAYCAPDQNGVYGYYARPQGFTRIATQRPREDMEVYFKLPHPDALVDELMLKSPALARLESEAALLSELNLQNLPLKRVNETELRAHDAAFFGGESL